MSERKSRAYNDIGATPTRPADAGLTFVIYIAIGSVRVARATLIQSTTIE